MDHYPSPVSDPTAEAQLGNEVVNAEALLKAAPSSGRSLLHLPLEVLEYIFVHVPPHSLFALSLTSKALHSLIFPLPNNSSDKHQLRAWRYLNLSAAYVPSPTAAKSHPSDSQLRPHTPPPEATKYLHNPTRILSHPFILQNTRTLILDGLPAVTVPFLTTIIALTLPPLRVTPHVGSQLRVNLLSIRGCPNLEDRALANDVLKNIPTASSIRGIYYFSDPALDSHNQNSHGVISFVSKETERTVVSAQRRAAAEGVSDGGYWVATITKLEGRVAFDTDICRGKDHFEDPASPERKVATMRIVSGCAGCGVDAATEDYEGVRDVDVDVLFPPVPVYSSALSAAKSATHLCGEKGRRPTLRCHVCLGTRYCRGCNKWWCMPCSSTPEAQGEAAPAAAGALARTQRVSLDCYECGMLCRECTGNLSRICKDCCTIYCLMHNEGSGLNECEWCIMSSRRRRGSGNGLRGEVEEVLGNTAVLTDPARRSQPSSPHLGPVPQPVVLLSSRMPGGIGKAGTKTKGVATGKVMGASSGNGSGSASGGTTGEQHQQQQYRSAGMRLRTMMGEGERGRHVRTAVSRLGTGLIGTALVKGIWEL